MNKQKFNQIVKDPSRVVDKDLIELAELSNDYPYSQIIHTLVAKGSQDLKLQNSTSKLHKAAFYVTDRGVLKQVMTGKVPSGLKPGTTKTESKKPASQEESSVKPKTKTAKPLTTKIPVKETTKATQKESIKKVQPTPQPKQQHFDTIESYDIKPADKSKLVEVKAEEKPLSEQVLESIAALKKAREQTQLSIETEVAETKKSTSSTRSKKAAGSLPKADSTTRKTSGRKKTTAKRVTKSGSTSTTKKGTAKASKAKKDSTAKVDNGVTVEKKAASKKPSKTKATTKVKTGKSSGNAKSGTKASGTKSDEKASKKKVSSDVDVPTKKYLKSIKKSKPKEQAVRGRQKEQIEIINKFIKEGGIKKPNRSESDSREEKDLSSESVEFHENLVSENLAKIFTSQKQYDKAIDIYKKLIWKFPQKKSYFAAQIEELKKI